PSVAVEIASQVPSPRRNFVLSPAAGCGTRPAEPAAPVEAPPISGNWESGTSPEASRDATPLAASFSDVGIAPIVVVEMDSQVPSPRKNFVLSPAAGSGTKPAVPA